jgi:hypothetical protein
VGPGGLHNLLTDRSNQPIALKLNTANTDNSTEPSEWEIEKRGEKGMVGGGRERERERSR